MKKRKKSSYFGAMINPTNFHRSQIKFYMILIPILLLMVLPIIFIISHAFKPLDELYAYPPRFFASRVTFDNFRQLMNASQQSGIPFGRYLFNSLMSASIVIFLSLLLSSLAAFAFSFLDFKGKKWLFAANQVAIMFVAIAVAVPRYIVMNVLGVTNSFAAHIVPLIAMPVGVFLLKQFMDQIPRELHDAAKIDGANRFQIYRMIVLPLVKPALATIAILAFQSAWNNVETSQLFISDEALKTLPYYFSTLTLGTSGIAAQGMAAAASLIIFLPNIILFIILQKNVMNTMAHSGLK
ncbi:carbohydrate ABC transporter permease [Mariniplasma sp. M4Ah]|uniref:Carbohydrate ABC transporter permease n=2 Tax=Peloplasma aerotolerans TaxID=3044389 RepID=A0AAW6U7L5_9MOLU|nr:carbohydrate ABC transporter permease [Mariniplasma sp. M4Ah]MDI6452765.1 carbohydrate ABC transporter permease [Mariniplasma sp. M4Ah]MDR4968346.1 carbohydrate ABC transporter permease [Acholeplasmataceae bacterium]